MWLLTTNRIRLLHASTPERDAIHAAALLVYCMELEKFKKTASCFNKHKKLHIHRFCPSRHRLCLRSVYLCLNSRWSQKDGLQFLQEAAPPVWYCTIVANNCRQGLLGATRGSRQVRQLSSKSYEFLKIPVLVQVMPHHIRDGLCVRSTSRPNKVCANKRPLLWSCCFCVPLVTQANTYILCILSW